MKLFNFASTYIIFDVITVFLLFFFAVFLLSKPSTSLFQQRILALFFIVLACSYMDGLYISLGYYFQIQYPHMIHFTMSFDYLVGPVLYLFVLSMTKPNFVPSRLFLLQGIPFVLHLSFLILNYTLHSYSSSMSEPLFNPLQVAVLVTTSTLHLLIYMVVVFVQLRQYSHSLKDHYSTIAKHNLSWLKLITAGLFLAGVLRFLNNILWLTIPQTMYETVLDFKVVAILCVFAFACTVVFRSLQQPAFLEHHQQIKYKAAPLDIATRQLMLKNIQAYMQKHSPYLNTDFDLKQLAEGVALKPYQVSQVINGELQQNFFDFVNSYRIEESRRLLVEKNNVKKNITQIMYETGFSSKSVFNTAFKKFTGVTPSEFRKATL